MSKKLIFTTLSVLSILLVKGQETLPSIQTTSPYSRYGYGILSEKGIGASKAMGGISYGLRNQNINPGNPASYTSIDSLTFIFDIGISYTNSKLSENGASQRDHLGGLDFLTMQFPVGKKIGVSVGFLPYSFVGYSFGNIEKEGSSSFQKYYSGSGGLSQVYGGVAYQPYKWISLGANVSYLYGEIEHYKAFSEYVNISNAFPSDEHRKFTINAMKFDIGVQALFPLSKTQTLIIGATYTPQISPTTKVKGKNISYETSKNDTTLIYGNKLNSQLPHTFGLGFTIASKKITFGADATFQKWKNLDYPEEMKDEMATSERFNDKWKFNAGFEYSINPNERNFFKRMKFRAGANYSNSYLNVKDQASGKYGGFNEYGATVGFGLPFKDNYTGRTSYVNIGFEYRKISPEFKTMIKEEYFGVSLNVNFNDLWFMKNKFK